MRERAVEARKTRRKEVRRGFGFCSRDASFETLLRLAFIFSGVPEPFPKVAIAAHAQIKYTGTAAYLVRRFLSRSLKT